MLYVVFEHVASNRLYYLVGNVHRKGKDELLCHDANLLSGLPLSVICFLVKWIYIGTVNC